MGVPRRRPDALADLIGWAMLGVGTGLTEGLFLGHRLEWRRPGRQPDDPAHARESTARTIAQTVKEVRNAFAVPGIRDVLDSILVRGEDDIHLRHHQSPANPRS